MSEIKDTVITISLLDPLRGQIIQSWEFVEATVITIGRAPANDVVVSDMLVSRLHGELRILDGVWQIIPLGRNGIFIDGRPVASQTLLRDETLLQLGSDGPRLEICRGRKRIAPAPRLAVFGAPLDQERKRGVDTNKTDNDILKSLQQQAAELKKNRNAP